MIPGQAEQPARGSRVVGGDGFDVSLDALAEAAWALRSAGQALHGETRLVWDRGLDAMRAIPPSDLQHAYAHCWTRWSVALEGAADAVADASDGTVNSGHAYRSADSAAAGAIDALGRP
jgi:hypothetical protein